MADFTFDVDQVARAAVSAAPPLSPDQRRNLERLLRGGGQ